jgi:hypothetical protein
MSKIADTQTCRRVTGNMREKETQGGCPASNTR